LLKKHAHRAFHWPKVRTALENLIQEESHDDGKDKHFATLAALESTCGPTLGIYGLHITAAV